MYLIDGFNLFSEEQNKTVNEYKFRVQKAEAEVSTLQANVSMISLARFLLSGQKKLLAPEVLSRASR